MPVTFSPGAKRPQRSDPWVAPQLWVLHRPGWNLLVHSVLCWSQVCVRCQTLKSRCLLWPCPNDSVLETCARLADSPTPLLGSLVFFFNAYLSTKQWSSGWAAELHITTDDRRSSDGWKASGYHTEPQRGLAGVFTDVNKWRRTCVNDSLAGHRKAQPVAAGCKVRRLQLSRKTGTHLHVCCTYTHTSKSKHTQTVPWGTAIIHLLQKTGDVVFAAGRPGEWVGVGCYVSGHQLGCLMAFGPAGITDPIVVHAEAETVNKNCD